MTTSKLLFAYFITFVWALVLAFTFIISTYSLAMYMLDVWSIWQPLVFLSFPCLFIIVPCMFKILAVDMMDELHREHRKHRRTLRLKARRK